MRKPITLWFLAALAVVVLIGSWALTRRGHRPPGAASAPTVEELDNGVGHDLGQVVSVHAGEELFRREWTPGDPQASGGDGLGPVYNATSCAACHFQNGTGGSGGLAQNVTTFTVRPADGRGSPREGVVHAYNTQGRAETLEDVHPDLPSVSRPPLDLLLAAARSAGSRLSLPRGIHLSQRNTPALFGAGLIDKIPKEDILAGERRQRLRGGEATAVINLDDKPIGRVLRLAGGEVGRFGWKSQSASLASFVRAACANELGLGNPGQAQSRPLFAPESQSPGLDLTEEQCERLTVFVASLARPEERASGDPHAVQARSGKRLFGSIGCADCHTPDLGPVAGLYSDLLLHRMGSELEGGGSYNDPPSPVIAEGPLPGEWRTPPLWGVADSAPYLHDGRAATLEEAILLHGGQAAKAMQGFTRLSRREQTQLVAFLKTLRAPAEHLLP